MSSKELSPTPDGPEGVRDSQEPEAMPAPRVLPDGGTLLQLRRQGRTLDEIAAEYGVTKGAVYLQLREIPGAVKPRPSYKQLIPWRVSAEHAHAYPAAMLRLLGRVEAGQADRIPANKRRMLESWCRTMKEQDLVVDYGPDIPPNPASPKNGGWCYRRRQPSDLEWIRPPAEDK